MVRELALEEERTYEKGRVDIRLKEDLYVIMIRRVVMTSVRVPESHFLLCA